MVPAHYVQEVIPPWFDTSPCIMLVEAHIIWGVGMNSHWLRVFQISSRK
uniref:Uncharacterized protein n=1 Tax=Arundo donax TaxID=35708 RepID=A0A0A9FIH2_ARUDO